MKDLPLTPLSTIRWVNGAVRLLDQCRLPRSEIYLDLRSPDELIRAIRRLAIRGAPALGIAGAYGMALAARQAGERGQDAVRVCRRIAPRMAHVRPTAVHLSEGVARTMDVLESHYRKGGYGEELVESLKAVGDRLLQEDLEASRRMALHGLQVVPEGQPVLTHCNTGGLATAGLGTALAVIMGAVAAGHVPEVFVDETRPLLQGGRLTMWELRRAGIRARLLCDGASGWVLRTQGVGCVLVGADRIAANGDTANKIGTFNLACVARACGIPFYVVAPRSSIDPAMADGGSIPVEQRPPAEITVTSGWRSGDDLPAINPAFDVTPADWITGWITERGVEHPPFSSPR